MSSNPKIVGLGELQSRVAHVRAAGKKVVTTNGCFDLLHVGHVRYLQAARATGDALVVGINGDESTRQLKGLGRPLNTATDRAEVVAALECVDLVAIFPDVRAVRFLELIAPDIYVKGGDYTVDSLDASERDTLEKIGADIRIIPLETGYSTTSLIERICRDQK
jgi:rfaE bifunctional protein nucleotidyltransferase chain/domain